MWQKIHIAFIRKTNSSTVDGYGNKGLCGKRFGYYYLFAEDIQLMLFQVVFSEKVEIAIILFLPIKNRIVINGNNHLFIVAFVQ